MISTESDTRSITPEVYAQALSALRPCLENGDFGAHAEEITAQPAWGQMGEPLYAQLLRGVGVCYPRIYVCAAWAEFHIAVTRGQDGRLYLFPDGPAVLLPGPRRDRAREIVNVFASLIDVYAASGFRAPRDN